jgi:hypothetical protein
MTAPGVENTTIPWGGQGSVYRTNIREKLWKKGILKDVNWTLKNQERDKKN